MSAWRRPITAHAEQTAVVASVSIPNLTVLTPGNGTLTAR